MRTVSYTHLNTGYGLCRLRVELVVDLGVHFTQELVFLVAEVLQQIDGYHQLVFFGPDNTRFRGQAHTEAVSYTHLSVVAILRPVLDSCAALSYLMQGRPDYVRAVGRARCV